MKIEESKVLFEKSREYFPGGVNSPVRAFGSVGGVPVFVKRRQVPIFTMRTETNTLIM